MSLEVIENIDIVELLLTANGIDVNAAGKFERHSSVLFLVLSFFSATKSFSATNCLTLVDRILSLGFIIKTQDFIEYFKIIEGNKDLHYLQEKADFFLKFLAIVLTYKTSPRQYFKNTMFPLVMDFRSILMLSFPRHYFSLDKLSEVMRKAIWQRISNMMKEANWQRRKNFLKILSQGHPTHCSSMMEQLSRSIVEYL